MFYLVCFSKSPLYECENSVTQIWKDVISVIKILMEWIEASKMKLFFCVTFSDIINIFFSLMLPAVHVMRIFSSLPAMCSRSDQRLPLLSAPEFSHHICDEESFKSHFGFWSIIIDCFHLKFYAMQLKKTIIPST